MAKLKPCPFCGSKSVYYDANAGRVRCGECGAMSGFYDTEKDSDTAWNRRPPEKKPKPPADVDYLMMGGKRRASERLFALSTISKPGSMPNGYTTPFVPAAELMKRVDAIKNMFPYAVELTPTTLAEVKRAAKEAEKEKRCTIHRKNT